MRFVSWNVNGLRACVQKGFLESFTALNADFFCLQETKLQEGQIQLDLPGYEQYWCYAQKKGYSGTAIFTRHTPQSVAYGIGVEELDMEGRVITLEYPEFYLVTCYTPNAQRGLARLEHRMRWEAAFREYICGLDRVKPVVLCGDLNVAHKEIDLKNPASNRGNAGFSDEERACFSQLLGSGFTDTFRHLHPDTTGAYTWWSYMFHARENNAGWRIDYFLVSDRLKEQIHSAAIHPDIHGSDHCPVELDLGVSCNGGIWWSSENCAEEAATQITKEKTPPKSGGLKAAAAIFAVVLLAAGVVYSLWDLPLGDDSGTGAQYTVQLDEYVFEILVYDQLPQIESMVVSWTMAPHRYTLTFGDKAYRLEDTELSVKDCNFFAQIFAEPEALGAIASFPVIESHGIDQAHISRPGSTVELVQWYDENGELGGWFVLGLLQRPELLNLNFIDLRNVVTVYSNLPDASRADCRIEAYPIIPEGEAVKKTAEWLADYLLHHPKLAESLPDTDDSDELFRAFEAFCATDHVLQTAFNLGDLRSYLAPYTTSVSDECRQLALKLHGIMAEHYTLEFPGGGLLPPEEVVPDIDILPLTELWIYRAINEVELSAYSGKTLEEAYAAAKLDHPFLQDLENAEDAVGSLLGSYSTGDVVPFLLLQPVYLHKMDAQQMDTLVDHMTESKGPAALTTDQLAYLVSNYRPMFEQMMFASSTVVIERIYEVFKDTTPMIAVLEIRSDAVDAMLSEASICVDPSQMLHIRALLSLDAYESRMTQQQRELWNEIYRRWLGENE